MVARIYCPGKTATQSGLARADVWLLEFTPASAPVTEPLMGWIGSSDTRAQVKLKFASCDEAVAYAKKHGLAYRVENVRHVTRRTQLYSDNFRPGRQGQWTH
ncbi:MAG: ETC complex I subunit [Hyphomicrobiales bacterium]|nr:ETC complex I subunit [Hyphomicrobiales bacterium]